MHIDTLGVLFELLFQNLLTKQTDHVMCVELPVSLSGTVTNKNCKRVVLGLFEE
jgi:hypothetical protein